MNDKISVVIPCHNAEKYIEKCLKSILKQTYKNIEVIVVNDHSTDTSKEIIKSFMSDNRIICIDSETTGVSAARNTGIKIASGRYIGFVDADDYIQPEMYEKLYFAMIESRADVAVCNYNMVYENENIKTKFCYSNMSEGIVNVYDNVYSYWANNCAAIHPNNYAWSRLYDRDVLVKSCIEFDTKHTQGEDTLFNFKLLPHLKKVFFLNEGLYNYVQHSSSAVHNAAIRKNLSKQYCNTFQELVNYYKEKNFKEFLAILPLHAYTRLRSVFFYSRLVGKPDDEIIKELSAEWKDKDIYKYLTDKFN